MGSSKACATHHPANLSGQPTCHTTAHQKLQIPRTGKHPDLAVDVTKHAATHGRSPAAGPYPTLAHECATELRQHSGQQSPQLSAALAGNAKKSQPQHDRTNLTACQGPSPGYHQC